MEIFIAFFLILGFALAQHAEGDGTGRNETQVPVMAEPAPCPEKMAEPQIRDLTVPYEERAYLLPSGKTCRPQSPAASRRETGAPVNVGDPTERVPIN